MKVSAAGRAAITQREGCRLVAYRDSRGIPTIGVGHVDMTPPKTVMGMRITKEQADALLAADLAPVEATINAAVKIPLSQNEFDALASLGFNIGIGGLRKSTVVARLNRNDRAGAAQAFLMWAHPPELMGRRRAEVKQFLTPDARPVVPKVSPTPVAPPPSAAAAPIIVPAPAPVPPPAPARVPTPPSPPAGVFAQIAHFFGR